MRIRGIHIADEWIIGYDAIQEYYTADGRNYYQSFRILLKGYSLEIKTDTMHRHAPTSELAMQAKTKTLLERERAEVASYIDHNILKADTTNP